MEERDPAQVRPSRRSVLQGAAAAGALGVPLLAGCGSEEPAAGPSRQAGSPTGEGTGGPTDGGGQTGGSGGSAVLGSTGQVPVGGGRIYAAEKVVVTQPAKGEFKAFSATCTHMGCIVGSVGGGTINCPCHGSRFDIETGKPVGGPATAPLPRKDVSVEGGEITLA